eukprot:TRINITY_DN41336_c0_g1_i1.p1 TRINITY_DN41336_c0_g1~~TRINITY_DN41336_c0_g1_i1.p1  ORF type:complete len:486 (+),score=127.04 TRINITY_DN41336_c0_g1_i1:95-1552(+)
MIPAAARSPCFISAPAAAWQPPSASLAALPEERVGNDRARYDATGAVPALAFSSACGFVAGCVASRRRCHERTALSAQKGRREVVTASVFVPVAGATAGVLASGSEAASAAAPASALLEVPRVLIGCWQLFERQPKTEAALQTLMAYADAGFRAFDTADIYGDSEEVLGKFRQRFAEKYGAADAIKIFTKYVPLMDSSKDNAESTNAVSRQSIGVEALDVVQYCWYGPFLGGGHIEAAQQLQQLQAAGRIRHLAGCNYDTAHLRELVDAGIPIEANQVQFSLLDLRPETGMLEYCKSKGIKLLCFGTVAGGYLSDKYLGAPAPPALLPGELQEGSISQKLYYTSLTSWAGPFGWDLFQELLRTLRAVADKHSSCIANVAMAWVQRRLDDTCGGGIIVGVRDTSHLEDMKALEKLRLDDDDMQAIRTVLQKGAKPSGDVWDRERIPGSFVYPFTQPQYWPALALSAALGRGLSNVTRAVRDAVRGS